VLLSTVVGPANAETPTRLDAIVGAGVLRVGLTKDYRPFSFADASGKVESIDGDMAMSLAQSLGVKLEIVKTSWPTLKSDLEAGGTNERFDRAHLQRATIIHWPDNSTIFDVKAATTPSLERSVPR
jgi:cyclohexadienyl dehydratase